MMTYLDVLCLGMIYWVLVDLPHGMKMKRFMSQPPSFVDPDHPTKVYKVVKALYGLHQAPRAWYV
ncbi:putative ribonuclease H-like domain-containing protein, partial [Tanacetum coccineum]